MMTHQIDRWIDRGLDEFWGADYTPKTPEQIAQLKRDWFDDPCWDIEDTEGFEAYRDELLAYRLECERNWEARRKAELENRANVLNCSLELAAYIQMLEQRIERLEGKIWA